MIASTELIFTFKCEEQFSTWSTICLPTVSLVKLTSPLCRGAPRPPAGTLEWLFQISPEHRHNIKRITKNVPCHLWWVVHKLNAFTYGMFMLICGMNRLMAKDNYKIYCQELDGCWSVLNSGQLCPN